jgi:NIMA (never in mitosis gene a)-related kinase
LISLKSPFILDYKEYFIDEFSNSLCIIMEFVDEGIINLLIQFNIYMIKYNISKEIYNIYNIAI